MRLAHRRWRDQAFVFMLEIAVSCWLSLSPTQEQSAHPELWPGLQLPPASDSKKGVPRLDPHPLIRLQGSFMFISSFSRKYPRCNSCSGLQVMRWPGVSQWYQGWDICLSNSTHSSVSTCRAVTRQGSSHPTAQKPESHLELPNDVLKDPNYSINFSWVESEFNHWGPITLAAVKKRNPVFFFP